MSKYFLFHIFLCGGSDSFMIFIINHILYSSICWLIVTEISLLVFAWLPHSEKKILFWLKFIWIKRSHKFEDLFSFRFEVFFFFYVRIA